jgi:sugar phosphate permease
LGRPNEDFGFRAEKIAKFQVRIGLQTRNIKDDQQGGFFYGWVIVCVTIVGMALIYGIRHSFAVFFSPILDEFAWSRGNISIMLSLNISPMASWRR